jgi:ligand-binding sensor domain-containing protein
MLSLRLDRSPLRLIFWVCLAWIVMGQAPRALASIGQWHSFTVSDGLIDSSVYAVRQDSAGVLWLGTNAGLNRFDGVFTVVADAPALASGVYAIYEHADGSLWFGTNAGLVRYSPATQEWRTFTPEQGLVAAAVRAIAADASGALWIGTTEGASRYDPHAGRWDSFTTANGLPNNHVNAISVGPDQAIWLGTDQGIARYDPTAGAWSHLTTRNGLAGDRVQALYLDTARTLWIGTATGVSRYIPITQQWQTFTTGDGLGANFVWSIHQDHEGYLWFGTNSGGVSRYDPATGAWETFTSNSGLIANFVRGIWEDREGGMWFATLGGVSLYLGRSYGTVDVPGLAGAEINALLVDRQQQVWAGTAGSGIWRFDGSVWQQVGQTLASPTIWSLYEDQAGDIWVGTAGGGVARWHEGRWQTFLQRDGLADDYVFAIQQGPDGRLWFGTAQGASFYDPSTQHWGIVNEQQGLPSGRVTAIAILANGEIWLGTYDEGVCRYDGASCQMFTTENGLIDNGIATGSVIADDQGGVWIGHWRGGISYWDGRQWSYLRTTQGLAADRVYSLHQARDGSLWVGTFGGLSRYDGLSWATYRQTDGLASNEVTALAEMEDGTMWVGTTSGLSWRRQNRTPPWSKIEFVNGRIADGASAIVPEEDVTIDLPASGRVRAVGDTITIGYVGGDLWTSDGDLVYLVRLGDEGTPWSVTHERVMTYKRLTPGLYRFEVMARDADLNYSTPQALLIEVAKPSALIRVPILGSMAPTTLGFLFVVVLTAIVGSGFGLVAVYNARRRPRQAVTRRFNPYISGEPIRRADMFFGREEVLRKILQTLHSNSIMIYGERRIGKTTLLHQIGEHLNQQDDPNLHYIPVYIDLEGTPQSIFFRTLMEEIVAGTRGHLAERPPLALDETTAEEYGDREFITDLRALLGALSQALAPQAVRVILLIDEMDAINGYDSLVQQQLRRVFMQAFSANLGAVVAGVHISKEWDRLESPWYNLFIETKLEPFTPEEARRLIEEPVRGVYTWDEEAVAFVIEKSEGRPYQIQQLCLEAVNLMIEARRERVLLEDVQRAYAITEHDRLA